MPPPPRRRGPPGADPARIEDRARGALVGLGVGDALGTTLEFKRLMAPPFPTLADGPHREMTGGGPFKLRPGQATDDSQMAACIAWCLRELGRYDVEEVTRKYLTWMPHAFDVGAQTKDVLRAIAHGTSRERAAREHWLRSGKRSAGNGSLMRCAPLGVFYLRDAEERTSASLEDAAITHFDFRCQLACAALNGAISAALLAVEHVSETTLLDGAHQALTQAAAALGRRFPEFMRDVTDANAFLRADLEAARMDDPELYGPELHLHHHEGFVRVAFRLAFWEALHAPTFEAGLVDVVNRGGDADTNGAIAGALLGAKFGEALIPGDWRKSMLEALGDGRGGPLWDVYHPRHLLLVMDAG